MDDVGGPWIPRPTPLASAVISVIRGSLNCAVSGMDPGPDKVQARIAQITQRPRDRMRVATVRCWRRVIQEPIREGDQRPGAGAGVGAPIQSASDGFSPPHPTMDLKTSEEVVLNYGALAQGRTAVVATGWERPELEEYAGRMRGKYQ